MPRHTVEQGEHVSRIAEAKGFSTYKRIWDAAENQALKAKRRNPNVLFPGDDLFIPDFETREEPRATDLRHRFQVSTTPLKLRIVVRTVDGEPIKNTACDLFLDATRIPLTTNGRGMVEHDIPKDAETARLVVPTRGLEFDLKIGHLDPVEEISGERARLDNVGYFAGYSQADADQLQWALEEFQCEHELKVTGEYDAKTQQKLEKDHGS
jgi:hypothetical protein